MGHAVDAPIPVSGSPLVFANDVLWFGYGGGGAGGSYVSQFLDPDTGQVAGTPPGISGLVSGVRGSRYLINRTEVGGAPSDPVGLYRVSVGDLDDSNAGWNAHIDLVQFGQQARYSPLTLGRDYVFQAGSGPFWGEPGQPATAWRANGLRGFSIPDPDLCYLSFICPTWATELDGTTATSPVLAQQDGGLEDGTVFTGTDAGTVYAVDATNGDVLWSTPVGSAVGAEPALADGRLYVPTADGDLVVLDAEDGALLWQADGGSGLHMQPAVAGGLVFTGSEDGAGASLLSSRMRRSDV